MTKFLSTLETNRPWSRSRQEMLKVLHVPSESGLDTAETNGRRKQYGPNRLRQAKRRSAFLVLAEQFRSSASKG
jgi:Ca2+-transporting ATPase